MHLHEKANLQIGENARRNAAMQNHRQHRRHPEVLASRCESIECFGEPRRMGHRRLRPSFETPRKRGSSG
jgi:hypothetical protein